MEKRQFVRVPVSAPIDLEVIDFIDGRKIKISGHIINLSERGLCLTIYKPLALPSKIISQIYLNKDIEPITIYLKLVWEKFDGLAADFIYGTSFINLTDGTRMAIKKFLWTKEKFIMPKIDKLPLSDEVDPHLRKMITRLFTDDVGNYMKNFTNMESDMKNMRVKIEKLFDTLTERADMYGGLVNHLGGNITQVIGEEDEQDACLTVKDISAKLDVVDIKEKRLAARIPIIFPVKVLPNILGETVDISENGICLELNKPLNSSMTVSIVLEFPFSLSLTANAEVAWTNPSSAEGRFKSGVNFLKLSKDECSIINEAIQRYKILDPYFVSLTRTMRLILQQIKDHFDKYEQRYISEEKQIEFIEKNKKKIFRIFDSHFCKIWGFVKDLDKEKYDLHQGYYQKMLGPFLLEPIETNRYIVQKPFGYAGDYMTQIYIFNYHSGKYLGGSCYQKLINNYTCNIPISCSNIIRKEFFKKKILDMLNVKREVKVLSVGCGPLQELFELLKMDAITKLLTFDCLDFESRVLAYISKRLSTIYSGNKKLLQIRLINKNILELIKGRNLEKFFERKYDLIYCSGVFDYLNDRVAIRLTNNLFGLLKETGSLIICNADKDNSSHRAYYEMLGDWKFVHRSRNEVLDWTKNLKDTAEIYFEDVGEENRYLFLHIKKKQ